MAILIDQSSLKRLRPDVYLIKDVNMPNNNFELDFETVSRTRNTVKEKVTASHVVTGDIINSDAEDLKKMFEEE